MWRRPYGAQQPPVWGCPKERSHGPNSQQQPSAPRGPKAPILTYPGLNSKQDAFRHPALEGWRLIDRNADVCRRWIGTACRTQGVYINHIERAVGRVDQSFIRVPCATGRGIADTRNCSTRPAKGSSFSCTGGRIAEGGTATNRRRREGAVQAGNGFDPYRNILWVGV